MSELFHETPKETYDRLAALFGERVSGSDARVRWVDVGAGSVTLTFFAPMPVFDQEAPAEVAEVA